MQLSTLEAFAEALKAKFLLPGSASPEDQLKPVVADLLKSAGAAFGLTIETRTETHLSDHKVRPDIAIYVGGLICGYIELKARRFWNELETPGPRVPLTKDGKTFAEAATLGSKLIWLHTYTERFRGEDRGDVVPQGKATTIKGISADPAQYPAEYGYDSVKREITVGDGRIGPVAPEVWEFEVSGLKVVQSWLAYRMKKRAGKKSSPLDDIRPEHWTARMSDEFLEMLWIVEATLAAEPELEKTVDKIVAGPCFTAAELPTPKPEERKAPGAVNAAGDLFAMMGVDDDEAHDDAESED